MQRPDPVRQAEELLADSRWITGIARSLVADPSGADDVVQDAWVAALHVRCAPVDESGSVRPWLARVVRNLAAKRWRGETRRAAREHAAAASEDLPSTAELVERAEMQRLVVEAVLALDEPYRTTILLAHIEGRTSVDIAERQGISESTVRWRIQRGLSLLRLDLERRRGREWLSSCALLLPIAERAPILAALKAATPAAALLSAKSALVAGAVLACGAVAWRVESRWQAIEPQVAATDPTRDAHEPAIASLSERGATDAPREEIAALKPNLVDVAAPKSNATLTPVGEQVSAALQSALGDWENARETTDRVLDEVDRVLAQIQPNAPIGIGASVSVYQTSIAAFSIADLPHGAPLFVLGEPHVLVRAINAKPRPSLEPR